jgi:hypothetical protein
MPARMGVSPGLYSLLNSGLTLTSTSLLRLKSVTDHPRFADEFKARYRKWLKDIWNGRYLAPGAQFMSSTAIPPPAQTRLHHFIRMKKSS